MSCLRYLSLALIGFSLIPDVVTTTTTTTASVPTPPEITSLPASVDLSEDTTTSTLLHPIRTYDANGDNVTCSIASTTPTGGPFFIKLTGPSPVEYFLYLTSFPGLNYTAASLYEVSIMCEDPGGASDTDTFYVYIVVNGMPTILNLQNSTTVSSTLSTGSQVFEVLTNDSESDSLTFTLTCVNSASCPFSIYSCELCSRWLHSPVLLPMFHSWSSYIGNSKAGVILLTSSLVDTTDLAYELDITVTDGYHATAAHRLTVFVSGLNTPPVLTNLPSTVNVAEDAASGTNIFTISIYDDDGDTSFTISDTYTPTSGATVFAINSITFQVSIATGQTLDYETAPDYLVNIMVHDGNDTSNSAILTILVADVNETPVLLKVNYSVVQDEGTTGTSFNAPTMEVTDPDNGDSLTYSMDSSSDNSCSYIAVNSTTGIMKYDANYDVDDTSLSQLFYCYIKVEDSGGLSVTATVTVSIEDVNDNNPTFVSNSYVFTVSQTASVGTTIGQVSATDDDVSTTYSDLTFTLDQSSLSQSYFAVNNNGWVTLAASLSSVTGGTTLSSTLYVKNTGFTTTDSASLHVTVVAANNNDDFWDDGANVAWVTLAALGGVALLGMLGYLVWKYWSAAGKAGLRLLRVKPADVKDVDPVRKRAARPARAGKPASPPSGYRTVTPTGSDYKWNAWNDRDLWI